MAKYIPYDDDETRLIPVSFKAQLQRGSFEYALNHLIEQKVDLKGFDDLYKNDHEGRPAYHPAVLLKIILFAYSRGITSSRDIEWFCRHHVIFMALACGSTPHYTSIAKFISGHPKKVSNLFEQILSICHDQDLLGYELFATDGCKLPSNAAKTWSGTHEELKHKKEKMEKLVQYHVKKHQALDQLNDFEVKEAQHLQQSIETLEKAAKKIEDFLSDNEPKMGQGKVPKEVKSNVTDNESAKMKTSKGTIQGYNGVATVDKKHQIIVDAQAIGSGQEQPTLIPVIEAVEKRFKDLAINDDIFDTGSEGDDNTGVILTADTGFANEDNMEYCHDNKINAYIPDQNFRSRDPKFKDQKKKHPRPSRAKSGKVIPLFPASDFKFDPVEVTCICPAGEQLSPQKPRVDNRGTPRIAFKGRITVCRECELKTKCMKKPLTPDSTKGCGRQVSFVLEGKRKPNNTDWMKHRIDTDEGRRIYSHRMWVVEPIFANITTHKRLRRFSLRGKTKVNAQWQLFCIIHNIEKIANYGDLAA
jgi:transposase